MSMTTQQIFDKVVNHMRAQGNPWGQSRTWSYINPDNPCQRCAKGILMDCQVHINNSEKWYSTVLTTFSAAKEGGIRMGESIVNNRFAHEASIIGRYLTKQEEFLLNHLETIFEYIAPIRWEKVFQQVAEMYNLTLTSKEGRHSPEEQQTPEPETETV